MYFSCSSACSGTGNDSTSTQSYPTCLICRGLPVDSSKRISICVSTPSMVTSDGNTTPSQTRSGAMYHRPLTPLNLHCLPSFNIVTPRPFSAPLYHLKYDLGLTDLCLFTTDPESVSTSSVYTSSIISDRVNTLVGFWSNHSSIIVT